MDENGEMHSDAISAIADQSATNIDEGIDVSHISLSEVQVDESKTDIFQMSNGEIRTLDGDVAGDEFASDAINYQVLLGKIDRLLEKLKLDA